MKNQGKHGGKSESESDPNGLVCWFYSKGRCRNGEDCRFRREGTNPERKRGEGDQERTVSSEFSVSDVLSKPSDTVGVSAPAAGRSFPDHQ